MKPKRSRAGIERKILTSILWVGIIPISIALVIGYLAARNGQSLAVRQTLLTATEKTVEGVELLTTSQLAVVEGLANEPELRSVLDGRAEDADAARVLERVARVAGGIGTGPTVASLYDQAGNLLHSSDAKLSRVRLDKTWISNSRDPAYREFGFSGADSGFWTLVMTAVQAEDGAEPAGFLTVKTGINSLLRYALAVGTRNDPSADDEAAGDDRYQVVYIDERDTMALAQILVSDGSDTPNLNVSSPDPELESILRWRPAAGTVRMHAYHPAGEDENLDVFLAYSPISGAGFDAYLIVYRPASAVFPVVNVGGSLALIVCVVGIALLCLKAYRDVHNNIVRPVSLLNEGAQIVRQGDFDLKLKIGTGDEIEELANSFNKMAVALKRNMRQLEESEEKYRSLVTSMRDGLYQTDELGRIAFLNPAAIDTLGFLTEEDAEGVDLAEMFTDEVSFDPASKEIGLEDTGRRPRFWMQRPDGRVICVEISRNVMYDERGLPSGVEGAIRDVTTTVELEEEARERSERISAINQIANVINSSLEAGRLYESLVVELKKLLDFDYAAVALLADDGRKFDGRQIWPDEETGPGHTFTLDSSVSSSAWVSRERTHLLLEDIRRDGREFARDFPDDIRSCLCAPLYATGRIIGTLNLGSKAVSGFSKQSVESLGQMAPHLAVAIRNASLLVNLQLSLEEVTRAREKLHEANEELKTLDELKTNLLSNVSHELRTPLVSVMGYNDMILNEKAGPITKTQQEYLQISLRNIEKLVTLIENLLDFSRLHRGDEGLVFDTFDLVDCARTSTQVVQPVADSRGVTIDLVTPTAPILVEGDKSKMGQVFNNLLSNAVKFNKPNGRIEIKMELGPASVEVVVRDTGIGIPAEALDKVFTRFYQYDASSTRKYGGTGIGLAIAQDIARLHGSRITLTSEIGEGSTFRFTLPLSEARGEGTEGEPALPVPSDTHVLIELLTSDRALSVEVRNLLLSEGMDMIHASSADGAVALALKHSPDCIVVDASNEEEDGSRVGALMANPATQRTPLLVLTNDDAFYERHKSPVTTRIKRSFRKSSFLSGIHHALSRAHEAPATLGDGILCVDDDPEILTFMERCLGAEGYRIDRCSSGEEALKIVSSRKFGLVLLDIAMPGMDGWETCRRIKSDPMLAGIKVYMVTAKPIEQNMGRMRESGGDGFLSKPFRAEDLLQLVRGLEQHAVAK